MELSNEQREEAKKILKKSKALTHIKKDRELKFQKIFNWLFLLGFLPFIIVFGSICRAEKSVLIWEGIKTEYLKYGLVEGIITTILYLNFYFELGASFYLLGYLFLRIRNRQDELSIEQHLKCIILSVWLFISYILLNDSIYAFLKYLPINILNGWIFIIYLIVSIYFFAIILTRK